MQRNWEVDSRRDNTRRSLAELFALVNGGEVVIVAAAASVRQHEALGVDFVVVPAPLRGLITPRLAHLHALQARRV